MRNSLARFVDYLANQASSMSLIPSDARIAVIGLGAAGIAAVLGLRQSGFRNVTVFEASANVGGTWVYSSSSMHSQSSMYESLRCNIPKQSMCFIGRPFPDEVPSFAPHADVASYLHNIAVSEDILPHVRFNSPVAVCCPVDPTSFTTRWAVQTYLDAEEGSSLIWAGDSDGYVDGAHADHRTRFLGPGGSGSSDPTSPCLSEKELFDAVLVCNGHYTGKKVVVLGKGPSGSDLALELQKNGADVFLSHAAGGQQGPYGGIVPQVPSVAELRPDGGVTLTSGAVIPGVDELFLCTGYSYSFPFLSSDVGISVSQDKRSVHGLLMHCIVEKLPTLSLIGIPFKIVPFPLFMDQSLFVGAFLAGRLPFPVSRNTLSDLCAQDRAERDPSQPEKYLHNLGDRQWEYRRKLCGWTGGSFPSNASQEIYNDGRAARARNPVMYRVREYKTSGDGPGEWRVFVGDDDVTGRDDPSVLAET